MLRNHTLHMVHFCLACSANVGRRRPILRAPAPGRQSERGRPRCPRGTPMLQQPPAVRDPATRTAKQTTTGVIIRGGGHGREGTGCGWNSSFILEPIFSTQTEETDEDDNDEGGSGTRDSNRQGEGSGDNSTTATARAATAKAKQAAATRTTTTRRRHHHNTGRRAGTKATTATEEAGTATT